LKNEGKHKGWKATQTRINWLPILFGHLGGGRKVIGHPNGLEGLDGRHNFKHRTTREE